jgi:cell division transport system ATP-binding protein
MRIGEAMITLENVWYRFGSHGIFSGADFRMKSGEFVYVVGPSGSGKSTLMRLIHMDVLPARGSVTVTDTCSRTVRPRDIPFLRRKVGMVFQDYKLLEDRNVFDNVAFALWATGVPAGKIKKLTLQVLTEVRISHKRYSLIPELSGGEQQRVSIARALVNEPYVLLADEPTGNLDAESAEDVMRLLKRINSKGTAVLMTTHREEFVRQFPGRLVRIQQERLVE